MSERQCFVVFRLTKHGDNFDVVSAFDDYEDAQMQARQVEAWEGTKAVLVRSASLYLRPSPVTDAIAIISNAIGNNPSIGEEAKTEFCPYCYREKGQCGHLWQEKSKTDE